jgi:hypothetical protein
MWINQHQRNPESHAKINQLHNSSSKIAGLFPPNNGTRGTSSTRTPQNTHHGPREKRQSAVGGGQEVTGPLQQLARHCSQQTVKVVDETLRVKPAGSCVHILVTETSWRWLAEDDASIRNGHIHPQ